MISKIRTFIESQLSIPLHFVHVTQSESFPCATIMQTAGESAHEVKRAVNAKVATFELTVFDYSYPAVEGYTDTFIDVFDGKEHIIDNLGCKFIVQDMQDESFPNPDGSDSWMFAKSITCQVRYQFTS